MAERKSELRKFKGLGTKTWLILLVVFFLLSFAGILISGVVLEWQASDWQAAWAGSTLLIAAIAAVVALVQLDAHQKAQREISRPYVVADFYFKSSLLSLEVKNLGQTPARDIRFTWDRMPTAIAGDKNQVLKRGLVEDGIPFLAPGRAIRYSLGLDHEYFKSDETPNRLEVVAEYHDMRGVPFGAGEKMILDLAQWASTSGESDYDNKNWNQFKRQTEALRRIAASIGALEEYAEVFLEVADNQNRGYVECSVDKNNQ